MEKSLEAKFGALEESFKNLMSSGQILESPASREAKAGSSTLEYHMFGVLAEVVSLAAVILA